MKITVSELYKDTMTASQYQRALRFAEAFRNSYDSAKAFNKAMQDYADLAAAYSFGFDGFEVLKFSVEVSPNARVYNLYDDYSDNLDLWFDVLAWDGHKEFQNVGMYLSDIWSIGDHDAEEHFYVYVNRMTTDRARDLEHENDQEQNAELRAVIDSQREQIDALHDEIDRIDGFRKEEAETNATFSKSAMDRIGELEKEIHELRDTLDRTRAHAQSEVSALNDEIGTLRATPGLSTADRRDACEVLRDRIQELGELMNTALESFDNGDEGASGAFFAFRKERTTLQKLLCALASTIA